MICCEIIARSSEPWEVAMDANDNYFEIIASSIARKNNKQIVKEWVYLYIILQEADENSKYCNQTNGIWYNCSRIVKERKKWEAKTQRIKLKENWTWNKSMLNETWQQAKVQIVINKILYNSCLFDQCLLYIQQGLSNKILYDSMIRINTLKLRTVKIETATKWLLKTQTFTLHCMNIFIQYMCVTFS